MSRCHLFTPVPFTRSRQLRPVHLTFLSCFNVLPSRLFVYCLRLRCSWFPLPRARLLRTAPTGAAPVCCPCHTHEIICFPSPLWETSVVPRSCLPPGSLPRGSWSRRKSSAVVSAPSCPPGPLTDLWWDRRCRGCVVTVALAFPGHHLGAPGVSAPPLLMHTVSPHAGALRHRRLSHHRALLFSPPVLTARRHP